MKGDGAPGWQGGLGASLTIMGNLAFLVAMLLAIFSIASSGLLIPGTILLLTSLLLVGLGVFIEVRATNGSVLTAIRKSWRNLLDLWNFLP